MRLTNVLIDCSHIQTGRYGGIYKYAMELVKGFLTYTDYHVTALVWDDRRDDIREYVGLDYDEIVLDNRARDYMKNHVLLRRLKTWPFFHELEEHRIEVVITPFTQVKSIVFPKKYRQIGVVHDLHDITRSRQTLSRFRFFKWDLMTRLVLKSMDSLVSISEDTRASVLKYVGRESEVIKNCIPNLEHLDRTVEGMALPKHYILDVNSWARYKNAEGLIRAFARISDRIPHQLYLKGSAPRNPREHDIYRRLVDELHLGSRVILDGEYMSEEQLNTLYKHADLAVSPSYMEGFGLTPIEAALHGVPTIASDIPTIREVTMGLLPLFDPTDDEGMAECILHHLEHRPDDEKLEKIAAVYRKEYSLERQIGRFKTMLENL